MLEVMVNGCYGKMGQIVCDLIEQNENLVLKCGFDKNITGEFAFPVYDKIENIVEKPDVIIDFSIPVATLTILQYAVSNHVPIVIATTGFTNEEELIIKEASKKIPIFKSANMSYDIMIMKKLVQWILVLLAFVIPVCFKELGAVINIDLSILAFLGWYVLASLIINEYRSILENLVEAGCDVPQVLVKGLEVASKKIDNFNENE